MKEALKKSAYFVATIWAIFLLNALLNLNLVKVGGILPRSLNGLKGIIMSPFLHANLYHIISNTIPLFVLLTFLFTFYNKKSIRTIFLIIIIGGLGVWIFGRSNLHVGASGLIYGLVAYLITKGIVLKKFIPLLIAIFIAFSYGGIIWGVLPGNPYISWEGHLSGAIAGVLVAQTK